MMRVTTSMNNSQPSFSSVLLHAAHYPTILYIFSVPDTWPSHTVTQADVGSDYTPQKEDIIKWKLYHHLNFWLSNDLRHQSSTLDKFLFFSFFLLTYSGVSMAWICMAYSCHWNKTLTRQILRYSYVVYLTYAHTTQIYMLPTYMYYQIKNKHWVTLGH